MCYGRHYELCYVEAQRESVAVSDRDRFLTVVEAARIVGLSSRTLDRYRTSGEGPAYYKFSNVVRYRLEDIQAWADLRRVTKPPPSSD